MIPSNTLAPRFFSICNSKLFPATIILFLISSTSTAQILPAGSTPTKLATGFVFTESPLYDGAGGVYFEDMHPSAQVATNPSRIIRYDIAGQSTSIVDTSSGGANGLFYNANHQIVSADRERRQISLRSAADVSVVQSDLVNNIGGTLFNGPNDLVVDSSGGIYFTDPDFEGRHAQAEATYYLNPQGTVSRILTGFSEPNGVILSPDGKTFYLGVYGQHEIMAYNVGANGALSNPRQFALTDNNPAGPDGLTVDSAGDVFAAAHGAIWAWNSAGTQLFHLAMPETPTNVELGGADGQTLFITAGTSLYSVQLNLPEPSSIFFAIVTLGLIRRRPNRL
jgi:gluconolactonase